MKKRLIKKTLIISAVAMIVSLFAVSSVFAALDWGHAREDGGQAGSYLAWGAGARSLGMGKAYVGLSDDASSVYWNAAGMTQVESREMTALYSVLWEKTNYSFLSYTQPLVVKNRNYGNIGIAMVNLSSTGFDKRDIYNNEQGTAGLSEMAGIVSYAKKLTKEISAGASVKVASQRIDTYSDTGYGLDLGLLYKARSQSRLLKPLTVGLSVQNLIAPQIKLKSETDTFPRAVRAGLAYRFFNQSLITAIDADKTENRSVKMHYGVEFSPNELLAIRAGLDETEITAGFGVNVAGFGLDYAFSYHDAWKGHEDLGNSHRFGMTYNWGK
ncbi:MAG: PorV/PorQ family protein [bacterium]